MTVGIVGLGLIGGSFARAYMNTGHIVLAADTDKAVLERAVKAGASDGELTEDRIKECQLILICTYPEAAVEYLEKNGGFIDKSTVVIDCCGTKRGITEAGMKAAKKWGFTYAGGHPMAGTQYSGFDNSKADMFVGAPMVIIPPEDCPDTLLERVRRLLLPCGFRTLTVTTAEKHDRMIAYTSQLAHVVSAAYNVPLKISAEGKALGITAQIEADGQDNENWTFNW